MTKRNARLDAAAARRQKRMAADAEQAAIDSADDNGSGDIEADGEDVESLDDLREQELDNDVASDTEITVRAIVGRERNRADQQVRERAANESTCESCFLIIRNEFLSDGLCPSCQ